MCFGLQARGADGQVYLVRRPSLALTAADTNTEADCHGDKSFEVHDEKF